MRSFRSILGSAALLLATAQQTLALSHADIFKRAALVERREPGAAFKNPEIAKRADQFLTDKTKPFAVNGTGLPDVPFDIGESYAGLLPISQSKNETRKLFFWFFPSTNEQKLDDVTVWFTGGPGCSSLSAFLSENGKFTWDAGTRRPVLNSYSWVNLTNMVWVEQPVGVGFDQGTPNITNEFQLADQFLGFWRNFIDTFDMHGWKMYLTGESYGGYYTPYISNAFILANDTKYYNLKGMAINDPIIGDGNLQTELIVIPFLDYWSNLLYINQTYMNTLRAANKACGFDTYLSKYFTFPPPKGPFPALNPPDECDVWSAAFNAISEVNPCFNIYHITDTCPHLWSVLGIVNQGDYSPPGEVVYFNRTDVQKAINAPVGTNWMQCTTNNVFAGNGNDNSVGPAQNGVLQRVIESTNNVLIGSGNLDYILPTNGTLFALQNMTWNGKQGFSSYPSQGFFVPYHPEYNGGSLSGAGLAGRWGTERGLTFYQIQLSGHELPGYAPGAGYRALEKLLGRIKDFSQTGDFTTQQGNFTAGTVVNTLSNSRLFNAIHGVDAVQQ